MRLLFFSVLLRAGFTSVCPPTVLVVENALKNVPRRIDASACLSRNNKGKLKVTLKKSSNDCSVHASWRDDLNNTGWTFLSVRMAADSPSEETTEPSPYVQMYTAGVLEGFLTSRRIAEFYHNSQSTLKLHYGQQMVAEGYKLLQAGLECTAQLLSISPSNNTACRRKELLSAELRQMKLMLLQMRGLVDGYCTARSTAAPELDLVDFAALASDGSMHEIFQLLEFIGSAHPQQPSSDPLKDPAAKFGAEMLAEQPEELRVAYFSMTSDEEAYKQFERFIQLRLHKHERQTQDIEKAAKTMAKPQPSLLSTNPHRQHGRCSALVRLTEGNEDLLMGHTTWEYYSEMTRVFKYYDFPIIGASSRTLAFSSYPGVPASTDDFYLLSGGLVAMETTLNIYNSSAFSMSADRIKRGEFVLDFLRPVAALRLARDAEDWATRFKRLGQLNFLEADSSQWMVVDYNQLTPTHELRNHTFYMLEIVPGYVTFEDFSYRLRKEGFWGSENEAHFEQSKRQTGQSEKEQQLVGMGDIFGAALVSSEENPRAQMWAVLAPEVNTLQDMRAVMQWATPGKSQRESEFSIAPRYDLKGDHPEWFGGADAKVTNHDLIRAMGAQAISGPEHVFHKPFIFGQTNSNSLPHEGLPELWNFAWQLITPNGVSPLSSF